MLVTDVIDKINQLLSGCNSVLHVVNALVFGFLLTNMCKFLLVYNGSTIDLNSINNSSLE